MLAGLERRVSEHRLEIGKFEKLSAIKGETMRTVATLILVAALFARVSIAQEKKAETIVLKGYVVDAMCGEAWAKKGNGPEKAAKHTKVCALNDHCSASGYGIFSDSRWVKFDGNGDREAKAAIQKSKKERGHYFEVRGRMEGQTFQVASLKELTDTK